MEGESVILTASAAAAAGYLSIYKVMAVTFLGTLFADQGLYFLGFYWGKDLIELIKRKFPQTERYMEKGFGLLEKYRTAYILIFRFIYGIRIVSPILIGSRHVPFATFAFLNFIAAIIWTLISCGLGYFFGGVILGLIHRIGYVLFSIFFGIIIVGGTTIWWRRRQRKKNIPKNKALEHIHHEIPHENVVTKDTPQDPQHPPHKNHNSSS